MKQIAIVLLFLIAVLTGKAQDANYVLAFGKLKVEWGNTDNTKITLYEDDKQIDTFNPESSGKFQFSLELNHTYLFWFSKPGYVTKKVQFDTRVPASVTTDPEFIPFPDFDFYVTLFESYPDVDTMFFTKPVGKIQFNSSIKDFDWDKEYTLEIQRSMEQIEKELSDKHDKQVQEKDSKQKEKEKQEAEKMAAIETAKILGENKAEQDKLDKQKEADKKAAQKAADTKKPTELSPEVATDDIKNEIKLTEPILQNEEPVKITEPQKKIEKPVENKQVAVAAKSVPSDEFVISIPNVNKVEKVEVAGKTTTQTEITDNGITLTYIKVEYTWGGKFYFIEDENNVFRNISEFYYNIMISKKK